MVAEKSRQEEEARMQVQLAGLDTEITRKQARLNALLQEGRSLDAAGKRKVAKLRAMAIS